MRSPCKNWIFFLNWIGNLIAPILCWFQIERPSTLRWEKTDDWIVGWAVRWNVYMLADTNYESESCHTYSDEQYFATIKHELAHCFSNIVSGYAGKPAWLMEGISIFLSGQNAFKTQPEKLCQFLEFYEHGWKWVYKESGFAVEMLITKYGKEKLISLLRQIKSASSREEFNLLFASVYGFELSYDHFVMA